MALAIRAPVDLNRQALVSTSISFPMIASRILPYFSLTIAILLCRIAAPASAQTSSFNATLVTDDSGNLVLNWPGQSGLSYHLESSPDLRVWTALPGSIVGTGGELTAIVRTAGTVDPARQFWRVVADPTAGIAVAPATPVYTNTLASVTPQVGVSYRWTITGGHLTEPDGAAFMHFAASTPGTVTITCTLTNNATGNVVATYSAQVAITNAPAQPIVVAPGFATTAQSGLIASVEHQAGATYAWTITGGTITAGPATNSITFTAGPPGLLTLACTVTRSGVAAASSPASVHVLSAGSSTWESPLSETSLPPFQVNLSSEGSRQWIFANMLRSVEAWVYRSDASAAEAQALANEIQVDAAGWPATFPADCRMRMHCGYQTGEETYLHGVFVLTWDGSGNVELQSSRNDGRDEVVLLNDQAHGRFIRVIKDPTKSAPLVFVHSSDPANPVRNMRLWAPAYDGAGIDLTPSSDLARGHIAGSLEPLPGQPEPMWHPQFLRHIAEAPNAGVLRFMTWLKINQANWSRDVVEWNDRADPTYSFAALTTIDRSYNRYPVASYRQDLGLPYEWMIDLCNLTGKDLWIQVPHIASPDLIRQLARLCATRLNPNLRVWFEYSNEIWNGYAGFIPQMNYARLTAALHFGVPFASVTGAQDAWGSGHLQGLALKTFEDEWRALGQPDARLINVVASFVASSSYGQGALDAVQEIDPHLPEVLAVTNYFGYDTQWDIFSAHAFGANPGVWPESLFEKTKEIVGRNLHATAASWAANAAVARAEGVPLVAYEGGQHMLPMGYGDWANPVHVDFMYFNYAFQRSPQIKDLYLEHYAIWNAIGGRTVSLYSDTGGMSFYGYWGAKEYVDQTPAEAPKWDAFLTYGALHAGVRAPSEPIGTRPVLPEMNFKAENHAPFTRDILASGGEGSVQLALIGGSLPPGISFTQPAPGTARLVGTPTAEGVYHFVVRALDVDKDPDFKAYTFTIDPAGVGTNALVTFRGQDIPATIPNNGWIARYDPARPLTTVRDGANQTTRIYLPFSIADGSALFNRESLEVPGTPKVIPATSPLNMYGGWSISAGTYADGTTSTLHDVSSFTGLRNYQWCNWSGDVSPGPSDFDALLLWRADQFNAMGGSGTYSFGNDATSALLRVDMTLLADNDHNELRFVVRDGGTFYISEHAYTSRNLGDGYFQLADFNGSSAAGHRWAVFTPTADNYAIPPAATLTFAAHTFTDVQAVGFAYHGHRDGWHFSFHFSRFIALGQRHD